MTARESLFMVILAALALGWASTAGATGGATAAQKCEAFKNTAAGAKALCRALEHAKQALGKPHNFAKCETRFMSAFAKAEQQAGGACPTEGDAAAIEGLVDACASDVAAALSGLSGGSPPAPCGQFPASGQTTVHRAGDDGAIQAGATLSYTDNGDGTITDNNTGLEWEKKSDDEAFNDNDNTTFPHDKDNAYTWNNAFAVHVAGLNTANFAGFNDWRLPNVKELQSIVNYEVFNPSVSTAFNTTCAGATVLTGSCTAASGYWSSTTFANGPGLAWGVNFFDGFLDGVDEFDNLRVRAVRGGSP